MSLKFREKHQMVKAALVLRVLSLWSKSPVSLLAQDASSPVAAPQACRCIQLWAYCGPLRFCPCGGSCSQTAGPHEGAAWRSSDQVCILFNGPVRLQMLRPDKYVIGKEVSEIWERQLAWAAGKHADVCLSVCVCVCVCVCLCPYQGSNFPTVLTKCLCFQAPVAVYKQVCLCVYHVWLIAPLTPCQRGQF